MNDDGSSWFLRNTLPHLNRERPIAIAVIPEQCGAPGFMRLDELRSLCTDPSYRITTCTHMEKCLVPFRPPPANDSAEPSYEAAESRLDLNIRWLRDHGLRWEVCVYAQGSHDVRIRRMCAERFRMGLGITPSPWVQPLATWAAPRVALQAIPRLLEAPSARRGLGALAASWRSWASYTSRSLEHFVRWSADDGSVLVLFDHGVNRFAGFGWPDVFDMLARHGVPIIDLYDAVEAFGNRDTTGDYVHHDDPNAFGPRPRETWRIIGADGAVHAGRGCSLAPIRQMKRLLWALQRRVEAWAATSPVRGESG